MKRTGMIAAIAAALLPILASAQVPNAVEMPYNMLPGIAVSGTTSKPSLPAVAVEFINAFYPGDAVTKVEQEFLTGETDVTLASGTEIDFSASGSVVEIEAPIGGVIPAEAVMAVLPRQSVEQLVDDGNISRVSSIESNDRGGFDVAFNAASPRVAAQPTLPLSAVFAPSGLFMGYDIW